MRLILALLMLLAATAARADRASDAAALEALLDHGVESGTARIEQEVAIDGCAVTVTATVRGAEDGALRLEERSRLEVQHYEPVALEESQALDLTARRYFSRGTDRGLSRWLEALAGTRGDPDRSARMREIQRDVDAGDYGAFAAANGYESFSYLEDDPEPYYSMPLPALALVIPEGTKDLAERAWVTYAERHCLDARAN